MDLFVGKVSLVAWKTYIREFKKLGRQLQRKRHIKIELCAKLSVLRLFHVGHVVKRCTFACFALMMKASHGRLADYVNTIASQSVPTCSTNYFSSFN